MSLSQAAQGVNFINILGARFLYESALPSFSLVTVWLWQKDFGKKALLYKKCARKLLMKLTHCLPLLHHDHAQMT